jgi:acetyltransferase-like isoleucine patch superfamily enzyme
MKDLRQNKWQRLASMEAYDVLVLLRRQFYRMKGVLFYRRVFGSFGSGTILYPPLLLLSPRCIWIGNGTTIRQGVRMEIIKRSLSPMPQLTIGDNVNIEQYVHIICKNRVTIGSNVSITGFCSIVDTNHPVDSLASNDKIGSSIDQSDSPVEICDGAFLGMGVRILPGVRVGRGAVIGANAVVTKDVPDFHIATGVPAVIRRARILSDIIADADSA